MNMIQRGILPMILELLTAFPAIYINGPRQAGKTTLVRDLLSKEFQAAFVSFDDILERTTAMRNPSGYLQDMGTPLIIDEVQMVPEIFRALKKQVDEFRHEKWGDGGKSPNGKYLLTGSANLLAIPALCDAMVGRMATLTLLPLSVAEIHGKKSYFLEQCFEEDFFSGAANRDVTLIEAIRKSSFPELLNLSPHITEAWFKSHVQKITLEDPIQLYRLEKAAYMPLLLQALAARAGNLINDADLSRDVGLNAMTTRNYRALLSHSFVTYELRPWYRNLSKRLVKSKKLYFYDTLLLCHLLGSTPELLSKKHPERFGHVLENFVLSELMKANTLMHSEVDISFYRTHDGREVDFVLSKAEKLVAIEVKYAEAIREKDLAGIKEFQQVTGQDFYRGIVLCNTPRVMRFDENIYLVPFSALWSV